MGADQSITSTQLIAPKEPLVGVDRRFCLPNEVTLKLREKIFTFSGDDFKITDANNGTLYFRIDGRVLSLRQKKTLLDNQGVPVLNIKHQLLAMVPNYKVYAGDHSEQRLFDIRSHVTFVKSKMSIYLDSGVEITLKGNWLAKDALIIAKHPQFGDLPIGKIFRPIVTAREMFGGVQDYYLTIAPGVDIAMIVALCIAYDEHENDRQN